MPTMDFRRDLTTISELSVGLVLLSTAVVGVALTHLVPGIGLATGLAVGAVISPTDAVATTIVRRAKVSPRLVTVLEGESMLNDATALVLLRSAIAATAATVTLWSVTGRFLWAVVSAVAAPSECPTTISGAAPASAATATSVYTERSAAGSSIGRSTAIVSCPRAASSGSR